MPSRSLLVIPATALALSLAACGPQERPVASPPAATPAAAAQAAPTPAAAQAAPDWRDLNGARAASGEGELQRRGFERSRVQGLTQFWNHAPSQTCLRVVTSQGRYSISQVPFTPQNCPL